MRTSGVKEAATAREQRFRCVCWSHIVLPIHRVRVRTAGRRAEVRALLWLANRSGTAPLSCASSIGDARDRRVAD